MANQRRDDRSMNQGELFDREERPGERGEMRNTDSAQGRTGRNPGEMGRRMEPEDDSDEAPDRRQKRRKGENRVREKRRDWADEGLGEAP